jgi:hypothetical protein
MQQHALSIHVMSGWREEYQQAQENESDSARGESMAGRCVYEGAADM